MIILGVYYDIFLDLIKQTTILYKLIQEFIVLYKYNDIKLGASKVMNRHYVFLE